MKDKVQKSLLAKYVLACLGILVVDFLVIMAAVQVATTVFVNRYLESNVFVQQETAADSLDQIVYEALSTYSRTFTADHLDALTDSANPDRQSVYQTIYDDAHVNDALFGGMATVIDGEMFSNRPDLWMITSSDVEAVESSTHWIDYVDTYVDDEHAFVILGKKLTYPSDPNTVVGTTFFFLRHSVILTILGEISNVEGYSFIVDGTNRIVAHNDVSLSGTVLFEENLYHLTDTSSYDIQKVNGEKSIVSVSPMDVLASSYNFEWHLVTVENYAALFSTLTTLQIILIASAVLILAFSVFLAVQLARNLILPINVLSQKLKNFDPNDPHKTSIQPDVHDELYQLEITYDEMVRRIYELLQKNKDDAEYQRKLELDSLQMQINPHFLYNTLDAIAWMAKIKKESEIEHLVLALARFFRISLHKGDKFITVEEELELIKYFVEIELFRFPDKFSISYHVSDEVKHYQVLKLVVQPIVENAIKHGMSSLDRMGNITINSYLKDNNVYIEIIDDGVGFNPPSDLLEKNPAKQRQTGGYGLINVNERIKLEYGPDYGLSVESTPEKGTKVTIKVAARI